ncbi:MAG: carbohydrate binding family 9 domain-containing protein [Bacteroidetes bacterium]|nr:carbohydrate binding family 9 domain-containing protein [Bacteroidota bacterium]
MIKRTIFALLLLLVAVHGQINKKKIKAVKIDTNLSIDGILDEPVWNELLPLENFVQFAPYNGVPASQKTVAHVFYDDAAIYVGATLFDTSPDSINTEIGDRDSQELVSADLFSIHICPYDDGINSVYFNVAATGVQSDQKLSSSGGDRNWDAVWESAVAITDDGWVVEARIPYSALRFPKADIQNWGFNLFRMIKRYDEWSNWSYVSNEINQWWQHYGILEGLENINPPLRLSFTPYFSSYAEKNASKEWETRFNGGMDLKYGISESFTLDMTLIPDFGQVQSDDEQLNLSAFEIQYNERRQFFTEGTELFSKGYVFYSRRIGSSPKWGSRAYSNLGENEVVTKNPIDTKLINATKFSGRTQSGLGFGILNAMTQQSDALIRDTVTQVEREFTTQPFTNYNIVVLDQTFANNSFVSLINTNVAMKGYMGNVTATQFRVMDNNNTFGIEGDGAVSILNENDEIKKGYRYYLNMGKMNGEFQYKYEIMVTSEDYNHNDLGFMYRSDDLEQQIDVKHNIFQPFGIFKRMSNEISLSLNRQLQPDDFTSFSIDYIWDVNFMNNYSVSMHAAWAPLEGKDYYEPRIVGRYLKTNKMLHNCLHVSTDDREKLYFELGTGYTTAYDWEFNMNSYWYDINPTYRFSDQLSLSYDLYYSNVNNQLGFVDSDENNIYFGKRQRNTLTNTIAASYIFSNTSSLSLRLRHYWSKANYDSYYELQDDGYLGASPYNTNHNINYNVFNIDMTYRWIFAPGSELVINWKNAIYDSKQDLEEHFWSNLRNTLDSAQINSLSVKFLYYLDSSNIF